MKSVPLYVLTVSLLLAGSLALAEGKISAIEVRKAGPGPFNEAFVRAHIEFEEGEKFERYALSRDVKALMKTGRFSDVKIYAEEDGDDVKVIYEVVNRRVLSRAVEVRGQERFSDYHISALLNLEPGDYIDEAVVGRSALKVVQEYRRKNYPDARAEWKFVDETDQEGYAYLVFTVEEGKKAKVAGVAVSGNSAFSDYELGRLMKRPAWWNPFWWTRKRKLDGDEILTGRFAIREKYRDAGYLDAEVGDVLYSRNEEGNIILNFEVREGLQFRIRKVLISGVEGFPQSAIRERLSLKPGDIASSTAIRADVNAVRDFYGMRGYLDTVVRPVREPYGDEGELDLIIKVDEGKLCYVRRIDIEGNVRTRDKVLRRELPLDPGDVFNEVKVRAGEQRIKNLGYFSSVRSFPAATALEDQRDLIIEVEEQRTGQFMMGAGFSSIDRATVFMEISQGNFDLLNWPSFTGGGQKLKLSAQLGATRRDFLLSFTEPWFMDRKLRFGFDLYDRLVKYDDYHSRRSGGSVRLGKSLGGRGRIDAMYGIEKLAISDVADTNEYFTETGQSYFFEEEEDNVSSSLRLTYTHDTRNNPFIPGSGTRFRAYGGITGGPIGFDTDHYETGLSFVKYVPAVKDHVLSLKASYDVVEEFGDTLEVPLDDRLFAGGGRTLRGFRYRDVGPKVTREVEGAGGGTTIFHKPIGGSSRFLASAEYSIPLVTPVRFALFYDTGNVWSESYELDLKDLASSFGGGFRFDVPGFPIRIDFADVIEKDDDLTRTEAWVLWIGYDF